VLEIPAVEAIPVMFTIHMAYFVVLAAAILLNTGETLVLLQKMGREAAPPEDAPEA